MKQILATVVSNTELMPGVYHIKAKAPDIARIAKPGQFVMVNCGAELTLRRPLSIHQVADSNQLSLLFNIVGKGTTWLSQRRKDESLDLLGPLGNSFSIEQGSKHLLLIAGGIGIAPLVFLAHQALAKGKSVTLLLGAATASQLYPRALLPDGIQIHVTTEDGSAGETGMITDLLPDFIGSADQVYACGPLSMYRTISDSIQPEQVKKTIQISLEIRMGCGLGTCYGCSIKTKNGMKRVCFEGPVFKLDEIIWQEVKI